MLQSDSLDRLQFYTPRAFYVQWTLGTSSLTGIWKLPAEIVKAFCWERWSFAFVLVWIKDGALQWSMICTLTISVPMVDYHQWMATWGQNLRTKGPHLSPEIPLSSCVSTQSQGRRGNPRTWAVLNATEKGWPLVNTWLLRLCFLWVISFQLSAHALRGPRKTSELDFLQMYYCIKSKLRAIRLGVPTILAWVFPSKPPSSSSIVSIRTNSSKSMKPDHELSFHCKLIFSSIIQ